ncbi:MAG: GNAT family N-acetyltransferase, partial [Acidimicrobiales bacterium]
NLRRDIDWPRPAGELDDLTSRWQPSATAYEIRSWRGPSPEALAEARARLAAIMPVEAPHGALGAQRERWDVARLREYEHTIDEMGRDLLTAVAVHRSTGHVVGFSDLTVSRNHPEVAYQWDTLVAAPHRGHRLGGLMKIATMRLLERGGDATSTITTFNLATNRPMIALNDALGARVTGCSLSWATRLA